MVGVGAFPSFLCAHRTADPVHAFADSAELRKQRVHSAAIVVQVLLTRVGDVVELAGAFDLDGGVPDFLEVVRAGYTMPGLGM